MAAHSYRPEIDGLRAIAVIPVILFHYGFNAFSGGFVGVDVFFVISGFLISSIILSEVNQGKFRITTFYERRIRRILPVLVCVIVTTAALAFWLLPPGETRRFGLEMEWSSIFSTNFLYLKQSNYVDGLAANRPLLHSWSLSVEEQFYIFFPLLILFLNRFFKRNLMLVIAALCFVSLVFSIFAVYRFPTAAFYLLPSRAWELLAGSLLAAGISKPDMRQPVREVVSLAGLLLIGIAVFTLTNDTPFPGIAAMLPVAGTAAVIWASAPGLPPNLVQRTSSMVPLVAIGKISYSLYLWHWPLLVFVRFYLRSDPAGLDLALLSFVTLGLSILTYFYVEQPFRRKQLLPGRKSIFVAAFSSLAVLALYGWAADGTKGFPFRLNTEARRIATYRESIDPKDVGCFILDLRNEHPGKSCELDLPHAGSPDFIFWGDSHAAAMIPLFDKPAAELGLSGLQIVTHGCPPLLGVSVWSRNQTSDCLFRTGLSIEEIAKRRIPAVILVARWPLYVEGRSPIGPESRIPQRYLGDDQTKALSADENRKVFERGLDRTIQRLSDLNIRIFVVEDVPESVFDVPETMAFYIWGGRPVARLDIDKKFMQERQGWINSVFEAREKAGKLTFLHTNQLFCGETKCIVQKDGIPLYRDRDHVSVPGALWLRPAIEPFFKALIEMRDAQKT